MSAPTPDPQRSVVSGPTLATSQRGPHSAQRTTLDGAYGPIAALRAGSEQAGGATVLLVPGYTGSKEDFVPLLDGIAGPGFEVIAIDLPGQYHSRGPDEARAYLPDALGEVLAKLVGHLAEQARRVLLLGHSYGGLVARGAVLAGARLLGMATGLRCEPDRVADLAASLDRSSVPRPVHRRG